MHDFARSSRIGGGKIAVCLAAVVAIAANSAFGDVAYSIDGNTLTVTASSVYARKGLKLLWDATDKGSVAADWSNSSLIVDSVPSGGGTYTVDLAALGITNDTPCRIASYERFARLDVLRQPRQKSYINTGVYDYDVYGIRFGYYSVYKNKDYAPCFASSVTNGFAVCANAASRTTAYVVWRGTVLPQHPTVKYGASSETTPVVSQINEFAFTNGMFTLNGSTVNSNLGTGVAVGNAKCGIRIGTSYNDAGNFAMWGCWSHVSLDGADGNLIRDYVPAQRMSDNAVGFYDRVEKTFQTSEGSEAFVAGTPTGETFEGGFTMATATFANLGLSARKSTLTIGVPSSCAGERLTILWDTSDKGDDMSAWAHSAVVADSAVAGSYPVHMSSLGMKNGDVCRVVAWNTYLPLDMLKQDTYKSYVDTGLVDSDVYGVRFGYYSAAKQAKTAPCIGSIGTSGGGFLFLSDGDSRTNISVVLRGAWLNERPPVKYGVSASAAKDASLINEIAFTNGMFTLNGEIVSSNIGTGLPVGTQGRQMSVGTAYNYRNSNAMFGWWSHVSFDGADGGLILDYIPVKRASDNAVGFWDRVTKRFMTSSSTGGFTAGSLKDEPPVVFVRTSRVFTVTTIPGLMIVIK